MYSVLGIASLRKSHSLSWQPPVRARAQSDSPKNCLHGEKSSANNLLTCRVFHKAATNIKKAPTTGEFLQWNCLSVTFFREGRKKLQIVIQWFFFSIKKSSLISDGLMERRREVESSISNMKKCSRRELSVSLETDAFPIKRVRNCLALECLFN